MIKKTPKKGNKTPLNPKIVDKYNFSGITTIKKISYKDFNKLPIKTRYELYEEMYWELDGYRWA